jgi:gluconate 5-dehydrogenase
MSCDWVYENGWVWIQWTLPFLLTEVVSHVMKKKDFFQNEGGGMGPFDLSGQVAIITGGSRGIGFAIAEGLAGAGAMSVVANRNASQGEEAAAKVRSKGWKAKARSTDVTQRKSVESLVSQVLKEFGRIDILVNSAAIIVRKPIVEVTDEEWDSLLATNLKGIFLCCQVVGRHMIERG